MTDINIPKAELSEVHSVLEKVGHNGDGVHFCNKRFLLETGENDNWLQSLTISPLTWVALGRPEVVTTAVSVGDKTEEVVAASEKSQRHSLPVRIIAGALSVAFVVFVIAVCALVGYGLVRGVQQIASVY